MDNPCTHILLKEGKETISEASAKAIRSPISTGIFKSTEGCGQDLKKDLKVEAIRKS